MSMLLATMISLATLLGLYISNCCYKLAMQVCLTVPSSEALIMPFPSSTTTTLLILALPPSPPIPPPIQCTDSILIVLSSPMSNSHSVPDLVNTSMANSYYDTCSMLEYSVICESVVSCVFGYAIHFMNYCKLIYYSLLMLIMLVEVTIATVLYLITMSTIPLFAIFLNMPIMQLALPSATTTLPSCMPSTSTSYSPTNLQYLQHTTPPTPTSTPLLLIT